MTAKAWLILPLVIGLLTSFISSRTSLLEARAGMTQWASARSSIPEAIIGIIAFPVMIAFLVAIFLVLRWYWGLALLAIGLFGFAAIVNGRNFPFFWKLRSLVNFIILCAAGVFWFGYFSD